MQDAQVGRHGRTQPAHAVMHAVAVEIGMKPRSHRDAQPPRHGHRRPAERPLGDHVHQVRPPAAPAPGQHPPGRQAETQPRIAGQGHARQGNIQFAAGVFRALTRTQHLDPVPEIAQTADQPANGHRHPVHLGRIGFGDKGDIEHHSFSGRTPPPITGNRNSEAAPACEGRLVGVWRVDTNQAPAVTGADAVLRACSKSR